MTHASLFSGLGGFDLAASWMGWRNAFHCEIDGFCSRVLKYHFPDAEHYTDIRTTDFTEWRGRVDILTGGFPCQPFSLAGRRRGTEDDRYLWPEMLRAVQEIRPAWIVGENVAGILSMVQPREETVVEREATIFGEDHEETELRQRYVVETVCSDLEREGYSVQPLVIPACAVGAPHRRDRVWFVARLAADPTSHGDSGRPGQIRKEKWRPEAGLYVEPFEHGRIQRGLASYPDIDRRRERTRQQVAVTERQGTPHDCSCGQNGIAAHPDEHRGTPRAAGEGTEGGGRRHIPQPEERGNPPERDNGLHGFTRDAAHSRGNQRKTYHLPAITEETPRAGGRTDEELPALRWAGFPTTQPVIRKGDDGIPERLAGITFPKWRAESVKVLGNAWCAPVAYEIFRAIQQEENEEKKQLNQITS